ncbi:MAG: hypothetical protein LBC09_07030 [Helicobacteraceae bacterium]|jgi:hypothetical protein|nr:hypothetical protein [Helicobacteraceae bacterium]
MRASLVSVLAIAAVVFSGCFITLSQKEIDAREAKCAATQTIRFMPAFFYGFDYADLEKIEVKQVRGDKTIDTFWVYPAIWRGKNGEARADARIYDREFNLSDSYHFTILGKQTFVATDIKMGLRTQYSCEIVSVKIDGVESDYTAFYKSGYKKPD